MISLCAKTTGARATTRRHGTHATRTIAAGRHGRVHWRARYDHRNRFLIACLNYLFFSLGLLFPSDVANRILNLRCDVANRKTNLESPV